MDEDRSNSPIFTKKGFVLWPSLAMLAIDLGIWLALYNNLISLYLLAASFLFSAVCLICFLALMVLRRPKKAVSFLIPLLLCGATGLVPPFPVLITATDPMRRALVHSRHRVEFLIYDARHHIKEEVRQNGYRYKEWRLDTSSGMDFLSYDVTDGVVEKDGADIGGCFQSVYRVAEHFYFVGHGCEFP